MSTAESTEAMEGREETIEEARENFDFQCHYWLGISATEFIRAYRAGELVDDDTPENFSVGRLAMIMDLFE